MKFFRELFELELKEGLTYSIILNKFKSVKSDYISLDINELCTCLDIKRTTAFSILRKLKEDNYIEKKGQKVYLGSRTINNKKSYINVPYKMLLDESLTHLDVMVYSLLNSLLSYNNTDEHGISCVYCSLDKMALYFHKCRDTIIDSISRLIEHNLISKFKESIKLNRYYVKSYKKNECHKSEFENTKSSAKVQKNQEKPLENEQAIDTNTDLVNTLYKENKTREKNKISRHILRTYTPEQLKKYIDFVDTFRARLGGKEIQITKKTIRLMNIFFEFCTLDDLDKIINKILTTEYLNKGNGKWVKNFYHFLLNDCFLMIKSGFYDKFNNSIKINNKFNNFQQRTYSPEFCFSLYDNLDPNISDKSEDIVPCLS